jgi:hypothetical protein
VFNEIYSIRRDIIHLAKVYDYLLEKSRVVQHGPGERTFHFFYYLFAGLEKENLEYFYLDDPETYRCVWIRCHCVDMPSPPFSHLTIHVLSSRILKDPCGGKVFPSRADFKHCRQMFNTQKDIMRCVGFMDEVDRLKIKHIQHLHINELICLGYQYDFYYSIGYSTFN